MPKVKTNLKRINHHGPSVLCPACGEATSSARYRYQTQNTEAHIYHCPSCTLEFLRPLPLAEMSERPMKSIGDAEMFHSDLLKRLHNSLVIQPEIRKVRKLLGRPAFSVLDVGCGTGWISKIWANSGAIVTGLEPSAERAIFARNRGIQVHCCYAEELASEECFDLIIIRHVVEHLENPAATLKNLKKHLNPGGLVLVVLPNIDCLGRRIFDTAWTWVLPWHCNFFNPRSLAKLAETCGLKVVKSWQTPSPLWYPDSFSRKYPRLGRLLKKIPLAMFLFAPLVCFGFLIGQSDNITMILSPSSFQTPNSTF